MNGLTSAASLSSWGEQKTLKVFVCEIIDSKLDFIGLKTKRLLDKFRRKESNSFGSHQSDDDYTLPSMNELLVNNDESAQLFEHLENMSRTISILERMKFSVSESNVCRIMDLLNDDKYMKYNDLQIEEEINKSEIL